MESDKNVLNDLDRIQSSIDWDLSKNATIEELELTGNAVKGLGNAMDNRIIGNAKDNTLNGGAGNDTLEGHNGNDTLDGGVGNDLMDGGAGNDTYYVDNIADAVKDEDDTSAGGTSDTVYTSVSWGATGPWQAGIENIVALGTANINLTGNDLDNTLTGNGGKNVLTGGKGNDTYYYTTGDTIVEGNGQDAGDSDTVVANMAVDLSSAVFDNIENATLMTGNGAFNLTGNASANILRGNAGNNVLDGKGGADTMAGGAGNDTYYVDHIDDEISEEVLTGIDAGGKTDSVYVNITSANANGATRYTMADFLENTFLQQGNNVIVNVEGNASNNYISGNDADNELEGFEGNDTLSGWIGDDELVGGDGNDSLDGYTGDDTLWGEDGNDTLYAGDGNDVMRGGSGNDSMSGGFGDDVYFVDSAGDKVIESVNALLKTSPQFDPLNDSANPFNVQAALWAASSSSGDSYTGADVVYSTTSFTLPNYVEILRLTGNANANATGNSLANVIIGNGGNNSIFGAGGKDIFVGSDGDDTYFLDADDVLITDGNGDDDGIDTVEIVGDIDLNASNSQILYASVIENVTLSGMGNYSVKGNGEDNKLLGNTGNNLMEGRGGADTLDGRAGKDTMRGGEGNDVYYIDNAGDIVEELGDQGTDEVRTTMAYIAKDGAEEAALDAQKASIENITLLGTAAINASGNFKNNVITGNSGANVLDGKGGADTLKGGAGNDTYIVGAGDVVTELFGEGTDSVQSSVSFTLGANVENLYFEGSAGFTGVGNDQNNIIWGYSFNSKNPALSGNDALSGGNGNDTLLGGAGNDTLDGGAGNDSMDGGEGSDTYVIDSTGDKIAETGKGVNDVDTVLYTLNAAAAYSTATIDMNNAMFANIEVLEVERANTYEANTSVFVLKGNKGNNRIVGSSTGIDSLDGGAGNDTLIGNGGSDTYVYDVQDVIVETDDASLDDGDMLLNVNADWTALGGTINLDSTVLSSNINHGETNEGRIDMFEGLNIALTDKRGWTVIGNGKNNALGGGAGNDSLEGGGGADTLTGFAGNDTLNGGSGNDSYYFDPGKGWGIDVIQDSAGTDDWMYFIPADLKSTNAVTVDLESGSVSMGILNQVTGIEAIEHVHGGLGNDKLFGNGADNELIGSYGNDSLEGRAGSDTLEAGYGNDTLKGGTGNDLLRGDWGNDLYVYTPGDGDDFIRDNYDVWASSNYGSDTLNVSAYHFEDATLTALDLDTNGYADALKMTFDGGGSITITDFFSNGGVNPQTLAAGKGYLETINFADKKVTNIAQLGVTFTPGSGSEEGQHIIGTPGDDDWFSPLEGGNGNDTIEGLDGSDVLYGYEGDDELDGGAGDDYLDGGEGNDYMAGGDGNDTYYVDSANDFVYDIGSDPNDTDYIYTTVSYDTPFGIESLSANPTLTTGLTLRGNIGHNTVQGGAGNDLIEGLAGNDLLDGDSYTFNSTSDDTLEGGSGTDQLNGGNGNDVLIGGADDDFMYGGMGDDVFKFSVGDGADYVSMGNLYSVTPDLNGFDTLVFDTSVDYTQMAFWKDWNDDIWIGYGSVSGGVYGDNIQLSTFAGDVDRIEIQDANGTVVKYLNASDINAIIADVAAYEQNNGQFSDVNAVGQDNGVMAEIVANWH